MNEKTFNLLISIIFISIFLVISLLSVSWAIIALNQGNAQSGENKTTSISNEIIFAINGTTQQIASYINHPSCNINEIKDINGNLIPASNYTISNCEIIYHE